MSRDGYDPHTGRVLLEGQHDDRSYANCGCGYARAGDTPEKHDAYWAGVDARDPRNASERLSTGTTAHPDDVADTRKAIDEYVGDDDHAPPDVDRGGFTFGRHLEPMTRFSRPELDEARAKMGLPALNPKDAAKETGDSQKKDDGKLRYDLIPPEALEELARVYTIGAAKYADNGWLNDPMRWGRIFRALVGHAFKWWAGERLDQTDGQHHLSSVAWCAFALMVYEKRGLGVDDRTPPR